MAEDSRTLMSEEEVEHGIVMLDSAASTPRFRRGWAATAAGVLLAGACLAMAGGGLRLSSLQGTSELFENGGLLTKDVLPTKKTKKVTVTMSDHHGMYLGEINGVAGLASGVSAAEQWELTDAGDGKVYITSLCAKHLSDIDGGQIRLTNVKGSVEKWTLTDQSFGRIMLTSSFGKHLSRGEGLPLTKSETQGYEKWTVKKVQASAVTCAAHKKSMASHGTAEALLADLPMQVFIESKSSTRWGPMLSHNYETTRFSLEKGGAETWTLSAVGDGRVYITSSGGKHLSDDHGEVSLSSHRDGYERWILSDAGGGAFFLKSYFGKRLSAYNDHLDTDGDHASIAEQWAIIKA